MYSVPTYNHPHSQITQVSGGGSKTDLDLGPRKQPGWAELTGQSPEEARKVAFIQRYEQPRCPNFQLLYCELPISLCGDFKTASFDVRHAIRCPLPDGDTSLTFA